jgi:hypothetical protein
MNTTYAKCLGCGSTGPITPCEWCQDAEAAGIVGTTTRGIIRQAQNKMDIIVDLWADNWTEMAIPLRNEFLDEYRRAEQTIEALAEARKDAR